MLVFRCNICMRDFDIPSIVGAKWMDGQLVREYSVNATMLHFCGECLQRLNVSVLEPSQNPVPEVPEVLPPPPEESDSDIRDRLFQGDHGTVVMRLSRREEEAEDMPLNKS